MSIKLQILIIVVIILAMLYIVNHVRKKSIDFKYALLWLFVSDNSRWSRLYNYLTPF